jgi:hypothetical protein
VAQLYSQVLDFLFVASYESQGYGGGIRTRPFTGYTGYLTIDSLYSPGAYRIENASSKNSLLLRAYLLLWKRGADSIEITGSRVVTVLFPVSGSFLCLHNSCFEQICHNIVTDLMNASPSNSSVNTVQHATIEEAVFSVDPTDASIDWLDSDNVICVSCDACPFRGYISKSYRIRSKQLRVVAAEASEQASKQ